MALNEDTRSFLIRFAGHEPADEALWLEALTHGSTGHARNYERLEFLGDRVLGLAIADWLHEHGYEFDIVTDADLQHEGVELLEPYSVVLTGTHCEYWSAQMQDAAGAYLDGGGKLMYLAGNGLYWVAQLDPEEGHTVEIRRVAPAAMEWHAAPGEKELAFEWMEKAYTDRDPMMSPLNSDPAFDRLRPEGDLAIYFDSLLTDTFDRADRPVVPLD